MPVEIFLDASYAIALSCSSDAHHIQALTLARRLKREKARLVTTHGVVLEIGNALSKPRYRLAAIKLLHALQHDPAVEIVPVSEALFRETFELFRQRPDKGWGLTDCVLFVVMRRRNIREALTADEHFSQAGFVALLAER
jgi:predicted nucleic acid-binding protein